MSTSSRIGSVTGAGVPMQLGVNGGREEEISVAPTFMGPSSRSVATSLGGEDTTVPIQRQIRAWYKNICVRKTCHSDYANWYQKADKIVNAISVSLTALTSSIIFTSISPSSEESSVEDMGSFLATVAGVIAGVNAVVQSLHKALGLAESAERHAQSYKQFTSMLFRLERLTCGNFQDNGSVFVNEEKLKEWANDYGSVLEGAPLIPQSKFDAIYRREKKKEMSYFKCPDAHNDDDGNCGGKGGFRRGGSYSLFPLARSPSKRQERSHLSDEKVRKSVQFQESKRDEDAENGYSVVESGLMEKTRLVGGSMNDFNDST